ncbi:hypothetical protein P692DRAFT_20752923 [Suillus brevipes Sb2]|nr:hypothetical protein P692DRAFT_20752923 [Suillus brevipes Sb2]
MSRASSVSNRSRRPSQEGNTDGTHDQSARLDDRPPPQNDTLPHADNREEKSGPSGVQLPVSPGISDSGPPRPSEPHIQGHTPDDSPDGGLAA